MTFGVTDPAKITDNVLVGAMCTASRPTGQGDRDRPDPATLNILDSRIGPLQFCRNHARDILTNPGRAWMAIAVLTDYGKDYGDLLNLYPTKSILAKWLANSGFTGTV